MLLQLNSSGLSCKVSVNCSVRDSWVSGTCDQVQCSQVQLSPGSDVDLSVESDNGTIFCTGSNGVSRETHSEQVEYPCSVHFSEQKSAFPFHYISEMHILQDVFTDPGLIKHNQPLQATEMMPLPLGLCAHAP
ncbi:uncharacterized protein LOC108942252 [Arapaima gigas]